MAGKILNIGGMAMESYGWWYEDEDYEGMMTNPDSYVPGSVAYNWLVAQVSPSMPTSELMDAAETLDLVYEYIDQQYDMELTLSVFKLLVVFDTELRSLVWDFIFLVKDYLYEDHPSVKVYTVELIYRYLQFRNPDRYL
jgi:hypothetical protein